MSQTTYNQAINSVAFTKRHAALAEAMQRSRHSLVVLCLGVMLALTAILALPQCQSWLGLSTRIALLLLLGIMGVFLGLKRPEFMVMLILGIPSLGPYLLPSLEARELAIVQAAALLLGCLPYALVTGNKRCRPQSSSRGLGGQVEIALLIWLGVAVLSAAYGVLAGNDVIYIIGDFWKTVSGIFTYFLVAELVRSEQQVHAIIRVYLGLAFLICALDILTFVAHYRSTQDALQSMVRAGAQFHSMYALALIVPIWLSQRDKRRWLALCPIIFVYLLGFVISYFRTGYLVFPVAILSLCLIEIRRSPQSALRSARRAWARSFPVLLITVSLLAVSLTVGAVRVTSANMLRALAGRLDSMSGPSVIAQTGTRLLEIESIVSGPLRKNPLLGGGLGAEVFTAEDEHGLSAIYYTDKHYIHNNYAEISLRSGLIGLVSALCAYLAYLRRGLKIHRASSNGFQRAVILGCMGVLLLSLLTALSTNTLYSPLIYVLMAATSALRPAAPESAAIGLVP